MATTRHDTASLTSRLGGWLPFDSSHLSKWLESNIAEAEQRNAPLHPVIRSLLGSVEVTTSELDDDPARNRPFPRPSGVTDTSSASDH